jgi:hypothetical protein
LFPLLKTIFLSTDFAFYWQTTQPVRAGYRHWYGGDRAARLSEGLLRGHRNTSGCFALNGPDTASATH